MIVRSPVRHDAPAPLGELLRSVARRLRLAWGLATAGMVLPAVLALAVVVVGVGRVVPWAWPEPVALAVVGVIVVVAAMALALRIPLPIAARAADRGLVTGDAFATALELGPGLPFTERVQERALRLAAGRRAADAVPLPFDRRRLVVGAALLVLALGLALAPNPQDAARQRQAAARRVGALRRPGDRASGVGTGCGRAGGGDQPGVPGREGGGARPGHER